MKKKTPGFKTKKRTAKKPVKRKTAKTGKKREIVKKKKTIKKTNKKTGKKTIKKALKKASALHLQKSVFNPIIEPKPDNLWESWQTFNPAAVYLEDKVHFLYRAIGEGGLSVLGYASSKDGIKIEERLDAPAYTLKQDVLIRPEKNLPIIPPIYCSGGGIGGCEDPRIVEIEEKIYMTCTAFSNWSFVRVALASIKKQDFLQKNWEKWADPVFISPPCEIHKNWVIFPEKINNKFAILHSISPNVLVDYFDSLDFDGRTFIKSRYLPQPIENSWEAYCRGAGPPPIKTSKGWLLLYHAVEKQDSGKYKLGAMLLDYNNPAKILFRAQEPVLEPDCQYENNGFKPGIVYSCGAVVIGETLLVYYGGADSVICVATAHLEDFVNALAAQKKPKLKKDRRTKIKKTH
jgi:beta-1,2-mannobiose phosphorylase / 1,2-beta-oligomannan phosphorylase